MGTRTTRTRAAREKNQAKALDTSSPYIRWFETLGANDVALVGGKNASLGEMIQTLQEKHIRVPGGFAVTAQAYWHFVDANQLRPRIRKALDALKSGEATLADTGRTIRHQFYQATMPDELAEAICQAYRELSRRYGRKNVDIAARSSATAEDLPEASFAGQQETFLNVSGEQNVLDACRRCFASLFTDRAISYREKNGFEHMKVALSVGVQKMVRSDKAGAGVMFSIDTESGFPDAVLIDAGWGLGETVVQGIITPDEYMVFKPLLDEPGLVPIIQKIRGTKEKKVVYAKGQSQSTREVGTSPEEQAAFVLSDEEILTLARWAVSIESHYGKPMDMEWAKDGETGEMFIVQARPETVQALREANVFKTYALRQKGPVLVKGQSIGEAIATGTVCKIRRTQEMGKFKEGSILVTEMTEPDWVPIIRKAAAIITNTGGRTSHAAIVSREYGIPAIVGTGNATDVLEEGQTVTVSCAEGNTGVVYDGALDFDVSEVDVGQVPETRTRVMLNIASPVGALRWWRLPADGIGLARMEFIIGNIIKVHPMALIRFDTVKDYDVRRTIEELTQGYPDKTEYFVDHLAQGIAQIAASQYPHPVLVRTSDFKTNEYASLLGGEPFEPMEENPMIGFRGASRYYSDDYREAFALECRAIRRVREQMGLKNVVVMIPFCRTLEEADRVLEVMAQCGLCRGEDGLQVYVMCEIPSNVILAEGFAQRFDGFSVGSNDLTQLTLGVDRDSAKLAYLFNETNEAIRLMIRDLIHKAHQAGVPVGICGQAPSDHPEFATFLVECGIDSISLNPDSFLPVKLKVAKLEAGG